MRLRPLSDRIVVERIASKDVSDGGIILPDAYKEQQRPQLGLVLAVGPGKKLDNDANRSPMDVEVGHMILWSKYAGVEQELGGGFKVVVLSEADVLAIVEPTPPDEETDGTSAQGD